MSSERSAGCVVLLTGATGFIGRRLWTALEEAGYVVRPVSRKPRPGAGRFIPGDFEADTNPAVWLPRLTGVHIIVNAAGAFSGTSLAATHAAGPKALFAAAVQAGVERVVQISALGADSGSTEFFSTKDDADRFLMTLPIDSLILRPSLVFGVEGRSASLLMMLATLPVIPIPRTAGSLIQPVHVDDLVQAVIAALACRCLPSGALAVVGSTALGLRDYLGSLRRQLGYSPARFVRMPGWAVRIGAALPLRASRQFLHSDSLRMLAGGSSADAGPLAALLGRRPRGAEDFIPRPAAPAIGSHVLLEWLSHVIRFAVAALWVWTGIVSLGLYPRAESFALLQRVGVPPVLQPLVLDSAAVLDIAVGASVIWLHRHPWTWRFQILVIAAYTVIISVFLPEFWLHPYGPITKNIPLLGILLLMERRASRRWNT